MKNLAMKCLSLNKALCALLLGAALLSTTPATAAEVKDNYCPTATSNLCSKDCYFDPTLELGGETYGTGGTYYKVVSNGIKVQNCLSKTAKTCTTNYKACARYYEYADRDCNTPVGRKDADGNYPFWAYPDCPGGKCPNNDCKVN